jgi:uncharacterized membrane protein
MIINWNGNTSVGLFLILWAILIVLFPPKYGNDIYGISTRVTLRNEVVWNYAQKLLAYSLIIAGLIFTVLGFIRIQNTNQYLGSVILLIITWKLSKYIINKILAGKYPN